MIYWVIDKIDYRMGIRMVVMALVMVLVDYAIQLTKVFDIDVREKRDHFIERCHAFLNR